MKEDLFNDALIIVEKLIDEHKLNGSDAITLIRAITTNCQIKDYTPDIINIPDTKNPIPIPNIINIPDTGNPIPIPNTENPILNPFKYGITCSTDKNTITQVTG